WLRAQVTAAPRRDNVLRPSEADAGERRLNNGESDRERKMALQRGTLVHRLLQSLPDVAIERRNDAALRFLVRNAADWSEAERAMLAAQLLALVGDARFAHLFAPGSRAEVAIAGRLGPRKRIVSGRIDRMAVTPSAVWIVDYKTNHAPPRQATEAPDSYVSQLAQYRAVLAKLYPDRPVRAALLWTESLEMMEISSPALDAALVTVISP
ncbi:MAG TPA: PD-(D/E)XK nuclease family protein, partial [Tardiphaga sp.]